MAENTLNQLYDACIHSVRGRLQDFGGVREMLRDEVGSIGESFSAGFAISRRIGGQQLDLQLLIPKNAPFGVPRVVLARPSKQLEWPHVEQKGLLCLFDSDQVSHDPLHYVDTCVHALVRAQVLIQEQLQSVHEDEFQSEWLSYWRLRQPPNATPIHLLLENNKTYSLTKAMLTARGWIIAPTDAAAKRFSEALGISPGLYELLWAPIILLDAPPLPKRYPATLAELYELAANTRNQGAIEKAVIRNSGRGFPWVVESKVEATTAYGGGLILTPTSSRRHSRNMLNGHLESWEQHVTRGFRGTPPWHVLLQRIGQIEAHTTKLHRYDHAWVHGRGMSESAKSLAKNSVLIVGLGSLGSGVADLLAKAGVGRLVMVDHDYMESENASRHLLGSSDVGQTKVEGVQRLLQRHFPASAFTAYTLDASQYFSRHLDEAKGVDLILSLTANWASDSMIEQLRLSGALPPVIYGWMEAHCAAGHALLLGAKPGCLHCVVNPDGTTRTPVSTWEKETRQAIPACGGMFQPYGAAELSHIQALVTTLALSTLLSRSTSAEHRVWLGDTQSLRLNGGRWNEAWERTYGSIGTGGRTVQLPAGGGCDKCR